MLDLVAKWVVAHPVARDMVLLVLFGTFVNWVTYKRTEEEWKLYEKEHPRKAALIRVSRALFPHMRKIPMLAAFFPPPEDPRTMTKDGDIIYFNGECFVVKDDGTVLRRDESDNTSYFLSPTEATTVTNEEFKAKILKSLKGRKKETP